MISETARFWVKT